MNPIITKSVFILLLIFISRAGTAQGVIGQPGNPGGGGHYPPAYGFQFDNFIYEMSFSEGLSNYKLTSTTLGDSIADLQILQGGWQVDLDTDLITDFEQSGSLAVFHPNPALETTDVILTSGSFGHVHDIVTLKKVDPMKGIKVVFDKNIARKKAVGKWDIRTRLLFNNATPNPITVEYFIAVGANYVSNATFTIAADSSVCKVTGAANWLDPPTGPGSLGSFETAVEIRDHLGNVLQWHEGENAPVEYEFE